jgi:hypothetical protein
VFVTVAKCDSGKGSILDCRAPAGKTHVALLQVKRVDDGNEIPQYALQFWRTAR